MVTGQGHERIGQRINQIDMLSNNETKLEIHHGRNRGGKSAPRTVCSALGPPRGVGRGGEWPKDDLRFGDTQRWLEDSICAVAR